MKRVARAAALGLLAACYPGGAETVQDLDTVTTQHWPGASFSTIHTYALAPTIADAPPQDSGWQGPPPTNDHSNDAAILAQVQANLNRLGWKQVDPATTTPDVDVVVSMSATRYVEYLSYPYWAWYPGWAGFGPYDGSWGVYYPWVTPASYPVVIDAGSLRIEMLDARTPDPATKTLTAIWTASLDGLISGTSESMLARVNAGIDQAFLQSPYL